MSKKIIIVGTSHPYRGGIAAFTDRLAEECLHEQIEVEVYTFTLQYPSFLFPGKTQFSDAKAPSHLLIHRKIDSINPFTWLKTGREIARKKPDVVLFTYWMSFFAPCFGVIADRVHKNKKTACIGLIHNMIPHEKSILDKCFAPYFVKRMNGFVALSKSVLADVEQLDKKAKPKIFSPHPLYDHYGKREQRELALQNLNLSADYRYLLFFGLVRAYKGLDWLLEAFADARLRQFPVKLIVAGEFYDNEQPYRDLIAQKHLDDFVIVNNVYIPDDKVKDYFNAADMVVQPYKSATQSGVTQIAYHFEKPMLVTCVGGLEEIVPDGKVGYAVVPDVDKIADALVDFYQNNRAGEFAVNIVEEKKKYEWSKIVDAVFEGAKQ